MTRPMKEILGCDIIGADGDLGRVVDILFDDRDWVVRYLVVTPLDVDRYSAFLLSPVAVTDTREKGRIVVSTTKDQAKGAPGFDARQPISRQMERTSMDYFGWGYYWQGPELWGDWATPIGLATPGPGAWPGGPFHSEPVPPAALDDVSSEAGDRQVAGTLRSASDVGGGYRVQALEDEIGHVEDFLVDEQSYRILCAVVDTSTWWFGRKVTVPTSHFSRIEWAEQKIYVDATRDQVKASSEYDADDPSCGHMPGASR